MHCEKHNFERVAIPSSPGLCMITHVCPYCTAAELTRLRAEIIPREPTEIMISAADAINPISRGTETHKMAGGKNPEDYYRAMVAAHFCQHDWQVNMPDETICMKCLATKPAALNGESNG